MRTPFLLFAALMPIGCTGSGNPFSSSQQGQRELPVTESLRKAVAGAMPFPRELDKRLAPSYVIEPGDIVLVQPADLDSPLRLPGDQPVLPDGTIHLGRFGEVVIGGHTIASAEMVVRSHMLKQSKDAGSITVRLVSRQSKVYYVLGEVNAPGVYQLSGRETVLDGILAAGGVTNRAALNRISMSRPTAPNSCRAVLPICYEEIVQLADTSTNYQLCAGDRIFVPAKTFCESTFPSKKNQCPSCGQPQESCFAGGEAAAGISCPGFVAGAAVPSTTTTAAKKEDAGTVTTLRRTSRTQTVGKPAVMLAAPQRINQP